MGDRILLPGERTQNSHRSLHSATLVHIFRDVTTAWNLYVHQSTHWYFLDSHMKKSWMKGNWICAPRLAVPSEGVTMEKGKLFYLIKECLCCCLRTVTSFRGLFHVELTLWLLQTNRLLKYSNSNTYRTDIFSFSGTTVLNILCWLEWRKPW